MAAKIVAVAQSAEGIDLASAESMQSIFVASVNEVITDGSVDADVLSAIATIIARVNNVIADVTIDGNGSKFILIFNYYLLLLIQFFVKPLI